MPLIPSVGRDTFKIKFILIIITLFLWIGVFLHLFPVWYMFITSIKPYQETFKFPPTLWTREPTFIVYKLIYRITEQGSNVSGAGYGIDYPFYVYLKNSFIITGGTMAIQIPVTALLAYSVSKLYTFRWSRFLFLLCIGLLMVPATVSIIPRYLIIAHFPFPTNQIPNIPFTDIKFPNYKLINTYWGIILPAGFSAFNFLLFKGSFDAIPDELLNAARLDGASELSIFRRIVLPISKPIFAVVSYFTFGAAWNQFLWPMIVLTRNKMYPLAVILYKFQYYLMLQRGDMPTDPASLALLNQGIGINGLMGISIIESIPVFIMFLIFREYLMTGIKLRGLK